MGEARQPLIQIEEMTKVFYTDEIETHALSGVHLSIAKGEYVAMSGPSGCGKSTLLSIIGLLDTPTSGRYLLNGDATHGGPTSGMFSLVVRQAPEGWRIIADHTF